MNTNYKLRSNNARALTLVEMLGILCVIAVLFTLSISPLLTIMQRARIRAEQEAMARIRNEIKASFRQDDMSINISAIPGEIPSGFDVTVFDNDTLDGAINYDQNAWYARIAKGRGQNLAGLLASASLSGQARGELQAISYNIYKQRRLLLIGPDNTTTALGSNPNADQRYLLLSFMFPPGDTNAPVLVGPGGPSDADKLAWFNNLYDFDWGSADGNPTGQSANWGDATGGRGLTYGQRVVAERIVQPRFTVTVNNLALAVASGTGAPTPADKVFVYANVAGSDHTTSTLYGRFESGGHSSGVFPINGLITTPVRSYGILEGRRIIIRRGEGPLDDGDTGSVYYTILSTLMNENMSYTAQ